MGRCDEYRCSWLSPMFITWHLCSFPLKGVYARRVCDIVSDESKAEVRSGTQSWVQGLQTSFNIEVGDWVSVANPK